MIAENPRTDVTGVQQTSSAWLKTPVGLVMATCFVAALAFAHLAFPCVVQGEIEGWSNP